MKIGRVFFGRGQGRSKTWENVLTVFQGKYSNRFDVVFSRPDKSGRGYATGTAIRYDDETVLSIADVWPKLALDDGFGIFHVDEDGNPLERVEGTDEDESQARSSFSDDDIPF